MKRRSEQDHTELQSRLMLCAFCGSLSEWVHECLRPASRGRRTDVTLFGTCSAHRDVFPINLLTDGYRPGLVVEWEGVGELLEQMEASGLL